MKKDINTLWKTLAANKQNSSVNHIQYCILRAMEAKGEDKLAITKHLMRKAFSPITNINKLSNGSTPFQSIADNRYVMNTKTILSVPQEELMSDEEIVIYRELLSQVTPQALVRRYSYFFTRQDIFEEYQLVQTAHAALELGSKLPPAQVKDLHFTCCGVDNLEQLENVERVLISMHLPYVVFREPDIGNQMTSIGVYPVAEHRRGILRNYKLLRFRKYISDLVDDVLKEEEVV